MTLNNFITEYWKDSTFYDRISSKDQSKFKRIAYFIDEFGENFLDALNIKIK